MIEKKPLWESIQAEVEEGVMAPPVGSIFGPTEYAKGIQAVIDYLYDHWRSGHDTSGAIHLLKKEKMIAMGESYDLIG